MATQAVIVEPVPTETQTQQAIEAIAETIVEKINEDEDDTQWVRDLFREEFASLREEFQSLRQQIFQALERVPSQETFNSLLSSNSQMTTAILDALKVSTLVQTLPPTPEPIVVPVPEPVAEVDPGVVAKPEPEKPRHNRRRL